MNAFPVRNQKWFTKKQRNASNKKETFSFKQGYEFQPTSSTAGRRVSSLSTVKQDGMNQRWKEPTSFSPPVIPEKLNAETGELLPCKSQPSSFELEQKWRLEPKGLEPKGLSQRGYGKQTNFHLIAFSYLTSGIVCTVDIVIVLGLRARSIRESADNLTRWHQARRGGKADKRRGKSVILRLLETLIQIIDATQPLDFTYIGSRRRNYVQGVIESKVRQSERSQLLTFFHLSSKWLPQQVCQVTDMPQSYWYTSICATGKCKSALPLEKKAPRHFPTPSSEKLESVFFF